MENEDYIHQNDIINTSSDTVIWQYAKVNDMTIISKDADFATRILLTEPPPSVIHLRIGNISMREFYKTLSAIWNEVLLLSTQYKLVIVFRDKIEAIN